jgi:acetylornithine deacetylase/succinyl-diaminopimelate desuccinylase-like protein
MGISALPAVNEELVLHLTREICRIPSPLGGEGPLATFVAGELDRLGFETELQEVVAGRPNVVAIKRGNPEFQSFVFNGHLDAVLPFGEWRQDPFQPWVEDNLIFGAGLQDMKGGVASLIAGAHAAANAELTEHGDIILALVMHHDTTGVGTKYFLESCAWQLDAGVCGEPTDLKVQLFHGGAWAWEISTTGLPRHQSRLEEGVNAITGMLRILQRLDQDALSYDSDPRYPHLPRVVIGTIEGGEFTSMTAERCVARGDIRFLPTMTIDSMKQDLRQIIDDVCEEMPGLQGRLRTFAQQWPYEISSDDPVVQSLAAAHEQATGKPADLVTGLPAGAFITDAADMVRHGIPTVVYGPGDWNTLPDESISIADLVTAATVYASTCIDIVTHRRSTPPD